MKKILILVMSCEDSFFKEQENIIRQTWLEKVKEYDNINYCFYTGQVIDKHKYLKDEHKLILRCEDDINNTFKKTYYAFNIINKLFEYDYVFRTNTSTYVNIDLLNSFVQQLDNDDIVWSSDLYSLSNSFCPYPLYLYGRGNGLLMSKKIIDLILLEGKSFVYLEKCDDWIIGNILNTHWINEGKDYLDYIKGYTHGWFKCVPEEQPNNHKLCVYGNTNKNWDFINKFITIQVKRYRERHLENEQYKELHEAFKTNKYENNELDTRTKEVFEYAKQPSVFIGSILGYTDFDTWKSCDKLKLYNFQVNNKASDDEERYNMKNRIWL